MSSNNIINRQLSDFQWANCKHDTAPHRDGQCCKWCAIEFVQQKIEDARREQVEAQHSGSVASKCGTANKQSTSAAQIADDMDEYVNNGGYLNEPVRRTIRMWSRQLRAL